MIMTMILLSFDYQRTLRRVRRGNDAVLAIAVMLDLS